jgi:hypothetical protein
MKINNKRKRSNIPTRITMRTTATIETKERIVTDKIKKMKEKKMENKDERRTIAGVIIGSEITLINEMLTNKNIGVNS